MKKVDYDELCTYLANVYKEATGKFYSNDFDDWYDDIERYENNATWIETVKVSENITKEVYEVDETEFIKDKCVRINYIIEYVTIGDTVNHIPYLSNYDYRKYVKNEL